ncbi:hypothetical protein P7C70_g4686, partial [Phenoliferia sp. Uapishka_3]
MSAEVHQEFPNEVWIDILASGELSYFDLKRVARVNKLLRGLCELAMFDEVLFRGGLKSNFMYTQGAQVELHPFLNLAGILVRVIFPLYTIHEGENYIKSWQISELTWAKEFATYPPVKDVFLRAGRSGRLVLIRTGVTVKDLAEGVVGFWEKETHSGEGGQEEAAGSALVTGAHTSVGQALRNAADHEQWFRPTVARLAVMEEPLSTSASASTPAGGDQV